MFRALELGADGETLTEMRRYDNEEAGELDPPDLVPPASFHFAERLYVNSIEQDCQLAAYRDHVRELGGDVRLFDFPTREDAVHEINEYVREKTDGLIDEMISADQLPLEPDVTAISAAVLKAQWENAFTESYRGTFHGLLPEHQHVQQEVTFMRRTFEAGEIDYTDFRGTKIIRLPFSDRRLGMYILLPLDYETFIADLEKLNFHLDDFFVVSMFKDVNEEEARKAEVAVKLPRFRISPEKCKIDVVPAMAKLGITHLSEGADFSRMSDRGHLLGVDIWSHKAGIDTDGNGVTASAASASSVAAMADSEEPLLEFNADRPFFFSVLFQPDYGDPDNAGTRDLILFSGHVVDAEGAQRD